MSHLSMDCTLHVIHLLYMFKNKNGISVHVSGDNLRKLFHIIIIVKFQKRLHADFQTLAIYEPESFFAQTHHIKVLFLKGLCSELHKNSTFRDTSSWACRRQQLFKYCLSRFFQQL